MSDLGRATIRVKSGPMQGELRGLHAKIAEKAREFAATRISFGKQGGSEGTHPKGATRNVFVALRATSWILFSETSSCATFAFSRAIKFEARLRKYYNAFLDRVWSNEET